MSRTRHHAIVCRSMVVQGPIETALGFTCPCRPETTAGRPKTSVWVSRVREFQVHHVME